MIHQNGGLLDDTKTKKMLHLHLGMLVEGNVSHDSSYSKVDGGLKQRTAAAGKKTGKSTSSVHYIIGFQK